MERTFVYLKPNTIKRQLIGKVITRFELRGLKIIAMKMVQMTQEQAKELYQEHKGTDFYEPLLKFVTSGPVIVMVLEGPRAIKLVRHTIGKTDPMEAESGSIRGDYGITVRKNIVHASDSVENAKREIGIFFEENELCTYSIRLDDLL
ncbi:MAG: nucleoside-diphosphate kinase [Kosmotoga sp.]|nr:MAG: nucleoside-diphosphate kinase [Kosmotoga sp.]